MKIKILLITLVLSSLLLVAKKAPAFDMKGKNARLLSLLVKEYDTTVIPKKGLSRFKVTATTPQCISSCRLQ